MKLFLQILRSRQTLLRIGAVAVLLFVVLFWRLGVPSFWDPDEAHYAETSRELLRTHDWLAPYYNEQPFFDKPVLFHWLQGLPMALSGPTEFAARITPALASLALIGVTAVAIALTSFDLRPAAAAPQGGPAIVKQNAGADEISDQRKRRYRGNPAVPLAAFGALAGTIATIAAANDRRAYYDSYYHAPAYGYYTGPTTYYSRPAYFYNPYVGPVRRVYRTSYRARPRHSAGRSGVPCVRRRPHSPPRATAPRRTAAPSRSRTRALPSA